MKSAPPDPRARQARPAVRRRVRSQTSLLAHGEPLVWLTGGALALCLAMIFGLLAIVLARGSRTFWPRSVVQLETHDGRTFLGEVTDVEQYVPEPSLMESLSDVARTAALASIEEGDGTVRRRKLRTGNFEETGAHYDWVSDFEVASEGVPGEAIVVERFDGGFFYGLPTAFVVDGEAVATEPERIRALFAEHYPGVVERLERIEHLETVPIGRLNARLEDARLELRAVELRDGTDSEPWVRANARHEEVFQRTDAELAEIRERTDELKRENRRYGIRFRTATRDDSLVPLGNVVRLHAPNDLGIAGKLGVYVSRVWEFLTKEPRESNSAGGVFPAIFGTVVMTLIMSILVVPAGVLAALYLHEYAKQGALVSVVRIAVGNLAGVPSIVFGVFGLGFFCYVVGASIDDLLFAEHLPNPTYGKGGLLWASLTLALLTLPVVIVATEEALAAVPNSVREGSYACGASKWQTIRRIVLPRAMPGIMTGMILAIARGAGEVAPLMLVGAAKLAPELPVDGEFPFIHPQRSFMHLGFHIYDVGFQSQNSEAAIPVVFSTTLLLIGIVVFLNLAAMWIRARLRRRFQGAS